MPSTAYRDIKDSLRQLYLDDPRPWLVGFSGGKDSTVTLQLIWQALSRLPPGDKRAAAFRGAILLASGVGSGPWTVVRFRRARCRVTCYCSSPSLATHASNGVHSVVLLDGHVAIVLFLQTSTL